MENKNYVLRVELNNLEGVAQQVNQEQQADVSKNIKRFVVGKVIQPFIQQTRELISTQVGLMTGQQTMQERWNLALGVVSNAQNIVTNVAGGMAFASAIGLSAGAGGLLGLGVMVLQKYAEYVGASIKINNLKSLENAQIEQTRVRAGWSFNKSRQGA